MPWVHAATRDQPLGICFAVIDRPLIHLAGKPHDLRRNVVDEYSPLHSGGVEILEQCFGRFAIFEDIVEAASGFGHDLDRTGLEQFVGLDVDVAVGDGH